MYLPKGKYCVYLRIVYMLAIVMPPPPPPPIWMTENHFRSHFSTFQINTQFILNVFTKCPPAAITFDRFFFSQNWCRRPFWITEIHFRSHFSPFHINTQLLFIYFFTKWLPAAILDDRKSPSIAFLVISDQYATCFFLHKMAAGGHFGWPKITFNGISRHFRSIRNFFFHKMAAGGHIRWPKINRSHF